MGITIELAAVLAVLAMILAALWDVQSTFGFLKRGTGYEKNPIMQTAFDIFGVPVALGLKVLATAALCALAYHWQATVWLWPAAAVTAYVAYRNGKL